MLIKSYFYLSAKFLRQFLDVLTSVTTKGNFRSRFGESAFFRLKDNWRKGFDKCSLPFSVCMYFLLFMKHLLDGKRL